MPSGDAQRQWFPEMIEILRQQWKPGLSWAELVLLAAHLDAMLQQIRKDLNIIPSMFTCPECGVSGRSSFSSISINATILAAGRFGIAVRCEGTIQTLEEISQGTWPRQLWKKSGYNNGLLGRL